GGCNTTHPVPQQESVASPARTLAQSPKPEEPALVETESFHAKRWTEEASEHTLLNELSLVYFEFDSAELTEESQRDLEKVAEWLVMHPKVTLRIEGHTDARGTIEYNVSLGDRRAQVIKRYLSLLGVRDDQLVTLSYGEELPAIPGDDEEAYAQNRRAQLISEEDAVVGQLTE
ncbi:MAG: OmpA family protein, partial [Myxococcota bacterium]